MTLPLVLLGAGTGVLDCPRPLLFTTARTVREAGPYRCDSPKECRACHCEPVRKLAWQSPEQGE